MKRRFFLSHLQIPVIVSSSFVAALTSGGCLDLERGSSCGDLVCPVGALCSEPHSMCVRAEQIQVCSGRPDGEACTAPGITMGQCHGGTCFALGCGNGIVDQGEVCDDGNTFDGDGCRADCRSDETCGNGRVDPEVGERCDDGNNIDGDECQSDCSLPRCGDGVVDSGEACDDGNDTDGDGCNRQCTSDETCGNGVIDVQVGETCDDGNQLTGDGCGDTCRIEVCGNDIVDPGEVCDDGNTLSGDGCGAACRSDETCGNGITDVGSNEQCDDGNLRSGDGCSSGCTVEQPTWLEQTPRTMGTTLVGQHYGLVFDHGRERVIAFARRETWEWDGMTWRFVETQNTPTSHWDHALVYDPIRRHVVLFGGVDGDGNLLDETWTYNGTDWTQLFPVVSPEPRGATALAYDATNGGVLLFGGRPEWVGSDNNDTWLLKNGAWTELATGAVPRPDPRAGHSMVYHPGIDRVVVQGGRARNVAGPLYDTWQWDGSDWSEIVGTPPSTEGTLLHDPIQNHLVLVGSTPGAGMAVWDGTWTDVTMPPGLPAHASLVFDAARGRLTALAGEQFLDGDTIATWALVGSAFEEQVAPYEAFANQRFIFDSRRHRITGYTYEFFDLGGPQPPPLATWDLKGHTWTRRVQSTVPDFALTTALEYDPVRQRTLQIYQERPGTPVMLFGEFGGGWQLLEADTGLPHNRNWVTTFDTARGAMLVTSDYVRFYEYDGTAWTQFDVANAPGGGSNARMKYEPAGDRVVIVGASGGSWTYDRAAPTPEWVALGSTQEPPGRGGAALMYFEPRGTLIYHGGENTIFPSFESESFNDTWELQGNEWVQLFTPNPPSGAARVGVYDPVRGACVVHGGDEDVFSGGDPNTWILSFQSDYPDEGCATAGDEDADGLSDCADPDCELAVCGANGQRCQGGTCGCPGGSVETQCDDGFDDDCDGLVDCADPDCSAAAFCSKEADCGDGTDDDGDLLVDCAEPQCDGSGICEAFERSCGDNEDNDGDGAIDCQDTDCYVVACATITP